MAIVSLAGSDPRVAVIPDEIDKNNWLINCRNGTLNPVTGELWPHDPQNRITKLADVDYNPQAECPRFMNFINEIMNNDKSKIDYIQRIFGYSLTGDISEQIVFFFYGPGSNGKSVLLKMLRHILGDYALQADSNIFMVRNNNNTRNEFARLKGARAVLTTEVEQGKQLSEVLIKTDFRG